MHFVSLLIHHEVDECVIPKCKLLYFSVAHFHLWKPDFNSVVLELEPIFFIFFFANLKTTCLPLIGNELSITYYDFRFKHV